MLKVHKVVLALLGVGVGKINAAVRKRLGLKVAHSFIYLTESMFVMLLDI